MTLDRQSDKAPTPYYQDGGITIYQGDCRTILPALAVAPDLVLTDPPYGIDIVAEDGSVAGAQHTIGHAPVHGDTEPFDPDHLLGYERVILWGANHFAQRLPESSGWIVWDKREHTPENWLSDAELAWCSFKTPVRVFRHHWNGPVRATERGFHVHPTQKPTALMRWVLRRWTEPGDLVLDPYMGSGPVAQACADLGRRYVGIEMEAAYCEIAVRRLSQQTFDMGEAA